MTPEAIDRAAFETFASIYPHEAYEAFPDEFWAYVQRRRPNVSREEMEEALRESGE